MGTVNFYGIKAKDTGIAGSAGECHFNFLHLLPTHRGRYLLQCGGGYAGGAYGRGGIIRLSCHAGMVELRCHFAATVVHRTANVFPGAQGASAVKHGRARGECRSGGVDGQALCQDECRLIFCPHAVILLHLWGGYTVCHAVLGCGCHNDTPVQFKFAVGKLFSAMISGGMVLSIAYLVFSLVIFIGEKDTVDSTLAKNADIVFYDGALQKYINADLKKFNGEMPRLELTDLTGDSLNEIIAVLSNGNDGKMLRILTLNNGELKEIFKDKDNKYINFTGNFIDGFKVNINNRKLNINKEIDLKNLSKTLIENKVFDTSGKYLSNDNSKIKTTGFIDFEFVQLTNCMGIKTKQRIITKDNKNIIDEVGIIWKFENGKWQIKEAIGVKLGNLLY